MECHLAMTRRRRSPEMYPWSRDIAAYHSSYQTSARGFSIGYRISPERRIFEPLVRGVRGVLRQLGYTYAYSSISTGAAGVTSFS